MRRRVPTQQLRGSDRVMLEVQIRDLVGKPLGQVAFGNIADLFALDEGDELPTSIRTMLDGYRQRIGVEIADLPNGHVFTDFAAECMEVEPARIPDSLRLVLVEEVDKPKRGGAEKSVIEALEDRWSSVDPEAFTVAAPVTVPVQGPVGGKETIDTQAPKKTTRARSATPRAKKEEDPAVRVRIDWVKQVAMERLGQGQEKGLGQPILMAGVRHRARVSHPSLGPHEILAGLKELEKEGLLRQSAGRWMAIGRYGW